MPNAIHYRHYADLCRQAKIDYPAGYRTKTVGFNDEAHEVTYWLTAYQNLPQAKQRHNIQDVNCPDCLGYLIETAVVKMIAMGELPDE